MNILLIWPYGMDKFGLNTLPLGLGYLAENIQDHDVEILDCTITQLRPDTEEFRCHLKNHRPDVIGISYWSFNKKNVDDTISTIKVVFPNVTIVVGGPAPSSGYQFILNNQHINFAFRGEGEIGFNLLLQKLDGKDKLALADIPGLIYRENDQFNINEPYFEHDLDIFDFVDYRKIGLSEYQERGYSYTYNKHFPIAPVITSRGCPYACDFCCASLISGRHIRRRSVTNVGKEIDRLYNEYGVREIVIIDDNFTFDKGYVVRFCREIIAKQYKKLAISTPNGIHFHFLDEEMCCLMKQAGWYHIVIAPETGSERMLKIINKKVDLSIVKEKVAIIKRSGLHAVGLFMIGYPGETWDDLKQTAQFANDCNFDAIMLHKFQPFPGTPVYDRLVSNGEIKSDFQSNIYRLTTYTPKGLSKKKLHRFFVNQQIFHLLKNPQRLLFLMRYMNIGRSVVQLIRSR